MNETQPTNINSKPNRLVFWIVFAIAIVIIIAGALFGAISGVNARKSLAAAQVEQALGEQFKMSQDDLAAGRYEVASSRLTWILERNPQYPGAAELLTEVLVKQAATATPTVTLTPVVSPTPDLRGVEELFNQATAKIAAGDLDGAQTDIDKLRKDNPEYKTVQVDGMYYNLLRSRGVNKIAPPDGKANLEGGIYDLTLAEHFGPLDNYAAGLRNFSRYYLTGASFWEIDWQQAYYYFSQVAPALPYLSDGLFTAKDRYAFSAAKYADKLRNDGKPCEAKDLLAKVMLSVTTDDVNISYRDANNACLALTPPTAVPTLVVTPEVVVPTVEAPTEPPPPTETPTTSP
jgi:hypothetical protein